MCAEVRSASFAKPMLVRFRNPRMYMRSRKGIRRPRARVVARSSGLGEGAVISGADIFGQRHLVSGATATYVVTLSRHKRAFPAGQKVHHIGNFLGSAHPAHGNALRHI